MQRSGSASAPGSRRLASRASVEDLTHDATLTPPAPVSLAEFDAMFEAVKNWGRWGPDDDRGTLNYLTPDKVAAAARLVRSGRTRLDGDPDQQGGRAGQSQPRRAPDVADARHRRSARAACPSACASSAWRATATATPMSMRSTTSATRASSTTASRPRLLTSRGSDWGSIAAYATGIVGRGVLLDAARHRGVDWLEPGEAVTRTELEAIEDAEGVRLGEGDILVFRTGHHARRLALGAWSNDYPPAGEGKAGLHVDTVPWMHERRIAAFLPDGDGETVPSNVEGMPYPIHPLQLTAMGMCISDSLQLEELAEACEEEGRWEFMVVGLPLRLPGATGSPWNPIAIF